MSNPNSQSIQPEKKNKAELDKLAKQVEELRAKLAEQELEKKSLAERVDAFEEIKHLMPEAKAGLAICRRESSHPGLHFKLKEKYSCVRSKDQEGKDWFIFKVPFESGQSEYKYHTLAFFKYFDWAPKGGEIEKGEDFLAELKRKQASSK